MFNFHSNLQIIKKFKVFILKRVEVFVENLKEEEQIFHNNQ